MSNDWHFLAYHSCRRIFCLVFMLIFLEVMHFLRSCIHNFLASSIHCSHAYVDFLHHAYAAFLLHAYVAFLLHAYVAFLLHAYVAFLFNGYMHCNLIMRILKGMLNVFMYCIHTVHYFIRTLYICFRYNSII